MGALSKAVAAHQPVRASGATVDKRLSNGEAKILILDIERLPGLARVFDPKVPSGYINANQFVEWPRTLCFAAKWYGKRQVMFHSEWDDGREAMVEASWALYDEADIVVTYNGKRFDNKHLKSDWATSELAMPKPWKDVDLLVEVRKQYGFESKSLQQVTKRFDLPGKHGSYKLDDAFLCVSLDDTPERARARREMARYNKGDVKITEALYDRLRGWVPNHPHMGHMPADKDSLPTCNQCGSTDVEYSGTTQAVVIRYVLYRCKACGGNVRGGSHSRAAITRGA